MLPWRLSLTVALVPVLLAATAQNFAPPPTQNPSEATLQAIKEKSRQLDQALGELRRRAIQDPMLSDVEIYRKAADWLVRHNEFYQLETGSWALEALDQGLARSDQLLKGRAPWFQETGRAIVRAYRSRVDGSLQPFAVTYPRDYGKDRSRKWRLDIVLHGRDPALTEVKFLHAHLGRTPAPTDQDFVRIEVYGRGNIGYRWAGETDIIEAVDNLVAVERMQGREGQLDPARVVLRGFSMGGAGTWHLGLHTPSRWCVLQPGAGFTATHGYVKGLADPLPPTQEACLHIYDARDYAENVADVPVVAYAGDRDPQLQAAKTVEEKIKPLGLSIQLIIAPGLGHQFPDEWQKKVQSAMAPLLTKGRPSYPERVRFVTYTLRYPSCAWVEILGLEHHYQRTLVDAARTDTGFTVTTTNVRTLHLLLPHDHAIPFLVRIDGEELQPRPWLSQNGTEHLYLERRGLHWSAVLPQKLFTDQLRHPRKAERLQGPIDDAFMDGFLCVRGTGTAWHNGTQRYADDRLERFQADWDKYMRGVLPVRDDTQLTEEEIATHHLILFGDPGSNSILAQVMDGLPFRWTRDEIRLGSRGYPSTTHVPVLIYPSPLSPGRYLVVNSGHTFHAAEFRATNALLFPRLGDYAILRLGPNDNDRATTVAVSGLFRDDWSLGD
jgi:predicted esterase